MDLTAPFLDGICSISSILLCIVFCAILYLLTKNPNNYPPGPTGLPVVGYVPFLGSNTAETLRKMKPKYGSVMSIQMGREDWIILNDYDAINEAFVKQGEKFSGRPKNFMFDIWTEGCGVTNVDYGDDWKSLRKFGHSTLRGFGFGKKGMEESVVEESHFLIENLTTKNQTPLYMKLFLAVTNLICKTTFGSRFSYDDERINTLLGITSEFFTDSKNGKMFGVMMLAPALRHFPPFKGAFQTLLSHRERFLGVLNDIIKEHEKSYDKNDIRDFIDAFLTEMKKENNSIFCTKQLLHYVRDLFEAGTGSTGSMLKWAILCLATYPEYQDKICNEIQIVIGDSGIPSMKHREKLPYTCAFIQELMRHRTLSPLAVFHKTNCEARLNGYTIPKDTTISPNIWSVHYDPDLFDNPTEFRPERFIDQDGKFINSTHVIPFSIGPRYCLGEQLARMEIFIFLIAIVQKLKIYPDSSKPLPSFDVGVYNGIALESLDFEVKFEKR